MFRWISSRLKSPKPTDVALLAALVAVALVLACPLLTTDTALRYAPMAEAFAAGEWHIAFHPRFGVGFPVLAGTLRFLTRIDGYTACTVVSVIAWALGVIPLFSLARRVFDERVAWFSVLLYLIAPTVSYWSMMGLQDSLKMLGLMLMTDAVFTCHDRTWRNWTEAVFGLALLVFFKVDAIAYALLLTGVYMVLDRFRLRAWSLLAMLALLLQPCCALVYDWTGYWVPTFYYIRVFRLFFGG